MGNPGRRPLNANEPKPPVARPDPPTFLNARARAEWRRVIDRLADCGLMTDLDVPVLSGYCVYHAHWSQALEDLERYAANDATTHGQVIKTKKENLQLNPLADAAARAYRLMMIAAAELGMSPSARSRLNVDVGALHPGPSANDGAAETPAAQPQGAERFFVH